MELSLDDLRNSMAYLSQTDAPRSDLLQALMYLAQIQPETEPTHFTMVETLVEEGFVYGLVLVLHEFREDDEILTLAVRLLCVIGSIDQFILSMVEYDAPGRVIFTLSQHMNVIPLLQDGLCLLGNMATNDHVKALIRMQQGIALVVDVVRNYPTDITLLTQACYALAVLCVDSSDNITEVITSDGLSLIMPGLLLVGDVKDNDTAGLRLAEVGITCLLNVTSNPSGCLAIVASGGASYLAGLLHSRVITSRASLLNLILQTLANMALSPDVSSSLVQNTAMMQGLSSLNINKSDTCELIVSLLCNVSAVSIGDKLSYLCKSGVLAILSNLISTQSRSIPLHTAVLECICNLVGHSDSLSSKERFDLAISCLPMLHASLGFCVEASNEIFEVVLRILARVSVNEKFGIEVVKSRIISDLALVLKRHYPPVSQAALNSDMVRAVFNCYADFSNEDVANAYNEAGVLNLAESFVQNIVHSSYPSGNGPLAVSPGAEKLLLSIMRCLINMSTVSVSAKNIAESMLPEILSALSSKSGVARNPAFLNLVASFLINLGLQPNAINAIMAHRYPESLIEIAQSNAANPELVSRFLMALNNMAISGGFKVKNHLKGLNIPGSIRASNNSVTKALQMLSNSLVAPDEKDRANLVSRKQKEDERKMKERFQGSGNKEAQLIARFNIPHIDPDLKTFVNAGKFMTKFGEVQNPHLRYVFVSPDLRFLVWRNTEGSILKSIYLLNSKEVLTGLASPELQRMPCYGVRAIESCSFVVVGAMRRASFMCDNQEDRDRWVDSLRNVIEYNRAVYRMEHGDEQQEAQHSDSDEDF